MNPSQAVKFAQTESREERISNKNKKRNQKQSKKVHLEKNRCIMCIKKKTKKSRK